MPTRQQTWKAESPDVQGDDSWVLFRHVKMAEYTAIQKRIEDAKGDKTAIRVVNDDVLRLVVDSWNWVDENGEPLPQPKDDPNVFGQLTDKESKWLADTFGASLGASPN